LVSLFIVMNLYFYRYGCQGYCQFFTCVFLL